MNLLKPFFFPVRPYRSGYERLSFLLIVSLYPNVIHRPISWSTRLSQRKGDNCRWYPKIIIYTHYDRIYYGLYKVIRPSKYNYVQSTALHFILDFKDIHLSEEIMESYWILNMIYFLFVWMIILLSNEFIIAIIKSFFKLFVMAVNFSSESTLDKKFFYRKIVIIEQTEHLSIN